MSFGSVSMLLTSWSNKNQNSFEPCHNLEFSSDSLAHLIKSHISTLNAKFTAKHMGSLLDPFLELRLSSFPTGHLFLHSKIILCAWFMEPTRKRLKALLLWSSTNNDKVGKYGYQCFRPLTFKVQCYPIYHLNQTTNILQLTKVGRFLFQPLESQSRVVIRILCTMTSYGHSKIIQRASWLQVNLWFLQQFVPNLISWWFMSTQEIYRILLMSIEVYSSWVHLTIYSHRLIVTFVHNRMCIEQGATPSS
jgi:hypothetical protein